MGAVAAAMATLTSQTTLKTTTTTQGLSVIMFTAPQGGILVDRQTLSHASAMDEQQKLATRSEVYY